MGCAGFDRVDLAACAEHGIKVARVPTYSPTSVAEHAVSLLMALNRFVGIWDACARGRVYVFCVYGGGGGQQHSAGGGGELTGLLNNSGTCNEEARGSAHANHQGFVLIPASSRFYHCCCPACRHPTQAYTRVQAGNYSPPPLVLSYRLYSGAGIHYFWGGEVVAHG